MYRRHEAWTGIVARLRAAVAVIMIVVADRSRPFRVVIIVRMRVAAVVMLLIVVGCGVAPVRRDGSSAPPPVWRYAALHARPLAFGGGVCEVNKPHNHEYPPSPRDAFQDTPAGLFDTRTVWPYFDRHPHHGRTCFREGWHLHLEKPEPKLTWDEQHAAWRAP